ncbi:MAG: DEAD/DEAH box helicase [Flavobacteriales bacterium]|tara:strand:- start:1411 stop:3135 length:1725 start_codon:yes stop_codon:yes gene_type:complete
MLFSELPLDPNILKGIEALGFTTPTPVQQESIPLLVNENRDLIGLAQTGTGKTAAFGLPMIHKIDVNKKIVQGLVIAPTRELCVQISNDFKDYSKFVKGLSIATIYGGASMDKQSREIRSGAQIVVATPGRLMDMMKRKMIKINHVSYVVLDEADEMLNMGFKEDIDGILSHTPDEKSTWLFSATMPRDVEKISKSYMNNPMEITVGSKNVGAKNIHHVYYNVPERDRYKAVKRILDFNPNIYGLIFCRTRRTTQDVADKLLKEGYNAAPLHGDLSQMQRDKAMDKFRDKTLQILVATDVAARGIDVNDISHVINYHLPDEVESYTHRSGRTARAGKKGVSIAIVSSKDQNKVFQIEKKIKIKFDEGKLPSGKEICEQQLVGYVEKIKSVEINSDEIADLIPSISKSFEEYSKEELIKRMIGIEFNQLLKYYENSRDISKDKGTRGPKVSSDDHQRFFINLGLNKGLNKGGLLRLICSNTSIESKSIGALDLFNDFSFFEVDKKLSDEILENLKDKEYDGKTFLVEIASNEGSKSRDRGRSRDRDRGRSRDRGNSRDRNSFRGNSGGSGGRRRR